MPLNCNPIWESMLKAAGHLFRGTLGKIILAAVGVGLLYLAWAYVEGIRYQMSNFAGSFELLVNRNLLAPWHADEKFYLEGDKWCAPGTGPHWTKTRRQCTFVGGAIAGCSVFTYGRSCAVIGVPKVYFDDQHFRDALRIALSNLCLAFPPGTQYRASRPLLYDAFYCQEGKPISFSVYINVRDNKVEPPYNINARLPGPRLVAKWYFSAWSGQITLISEEPR